MLKRKNGVWEHEKYMTISVVTNPDRAKRLLWFKLPISDNCDLILDGDSTKHGKFVTTPTNTICHL